MKKVLILSSILVFTTFFCTGCKKNKEQVGGNSEEPIQEANESSKGWLIRPGIGIGEIQFGMTVQQINDILGQPDAKTGMSYIYTAQGLEIVFRDNNLTYIYCGNPNNQNSPMFKAMEKACKFKTAEGIGIGSTEAQVIKVFGQPTKRKDDQLIYIEKRICFFLADGDVIGMWIRK